MSLPTTENRLEIVVDESLPGVVQLVAAGLVTLPPLRDALSELARLHQRSPALRCLLLDTANVERFGRGAVVEAARWITRNARAIDTAIIITHSPSLKSAVLALSACAPKLRCVVVARREEALALVPARTLSMTG